ncbi:hypothetical protein [Kingella oralis]
MERWRLADMAINQRSLFNALFGDELSPLHCVSCFQAALNHQRQPEKQK